MFQLESFIFSTNDGMNVPAGKLLFYINDGMNVPDRKPGSTGRYHT